MLAGRLQWLTPAFSARMEDTFRVRLHLPSAPGSGAALRQRLRASSRRSHRPTGQAKRQERTHRWIKVGGKVTSDPSTCASSHTNPLEVGAYGAKSCSDRLTLTCISATFERLPSNSSVTRDTPSE